jgi:hypothetical protein
MQSKHVALDQETRSCTWHQVPHCVNDVRRDIQKDVIVGVANAIVPLLRSSRRNVCVVLDKKANAWYRGEILGNHSRGQARTRPGLRPIDRLVWNIPSVLIDHPFCLKCIRYLA